MEKKNVFVLVGSYSYNGEFETCVFGVYNNQSDAANAFKAQVLEEKELDWVKECLQDRVENGYTTPSTCKEYSSPNSWLIINGEGNIFNHIEINEMDVQ